MPMMLLKSFERFNDKISNIMEWVGLIAFVFMMLLTTSDVIGAKIFKAPIPGALDLMTLSQLICACFALAASYIAGRHVQVDFFMPLLPGPAQWAANLLIRVLTLLFLAVLTWQMFEYGYGLKSYGEVSPTIRLPLYPFVFASAAALVPACLVALSKIFKSISEVMKR